MLDENEKVGYAIIDLRRMEPYVPKTWGTEKEAKKELYELLRYTKDKQWKKRLVIREYSYLEQKKLRQRNSPTPWIRPNEEV